MGEHARCLGDRLRRCPSVGFLVRFSEPRVEEHLAHDAVEVGPASLILASCNLLLEEGAGALREDGLSSWPVLLILVVKHGLRQPGHIL
jgi:hypothetical protein